MPTLTFVDCDFGKISWNLDGKSVWSHLNQANQYAVSDAKIGESKMATAAEHIGSTTETWESVKPKSKKEFIEAHEKRNPGKIDQAKKRIAARLKLMTKQLQTLSGMDIEESTADHQPHDLVGQFVDDLVSKGYTGKRIEQEILAKEAGAEGYIPASAEMEKQNIDGIINGETYSVKPEKYSEKQIHELGTDVVITYNLSFDKKTCLVTVNYQIHRFTKR